MEIHVTTTGDVFLIDYIGNTNDVFAGKSIPDNYYTDNWYVGMLEDSKVIESTLIDILYSIDS